MFFKRIFPILETRETLKKLLKDTPGTFCFRKNLVLPATANSQKSLEHQKKLIRIKKEKRKKVSEKISEALSALELKFTVQVGEDDRLFGSVTSMDIAKKLQELGHEVDKRKINLETPIKKLGEFTVPVKLDEGLTAELKVIVDKE